MRTVQNPQMFFDESNISNIQLNLNSRDDIPPILMGLQHIHGIPKLREQIFGELKQLLHYRKNILGETQNEKVSSCRGRPGMEQWKILVLGTLRLGLNADYDRIHELANQHQTIRQMLGHSSWNDYKYSVQTIY